MKEKKKSKSHNLKDSIDFKKSKARKRFKFKEHAQPDFKKSKARKRFKFKEHAQPDFNKYNELPEILFNEKRPIDYHKETNKITPADTMKSPNAVGIVSEKKLEELKTKEVNKSLTVHMTKFMPKIFCITLIDYIKGIIKINNDNFFEFIKFANNNNINIEQVLQEIFQESNILKLLEQANIKKNKANPAICRPDVLNMMQKTRLSNARQVKY